MGYLYSINSDSGVWHGLSASLWQGEAAWEPSLFSSSLPHSRHPCAPLLLLPAVAPSEASWGQFCRLLPCRPHWCSPAAITPIPPTHPSLLGYFLLFPPKATAWGRKGLLLRGDPLPQRSLRRPLLGAQRIQRWTWPMLLLLQVRDVLKGGGASVWNQGMGENQFSAGGSATLLFWKGPHCVWHQTLACRLQLCVGLRQRRIIRDAHPSGGVILAGLWSHCLSSCCEGLHPRPFTLQSPKAFCCKAAALSTRLILWFSMMLPFVTNSPW